MIQSAIKKYTIHHIICMKTFYYTEMDKRHEKVISVATCKNIHYQSKIWTHFPIKENKEVYPNL